MELVLAEKPSVARDLARVLGVRPSGDHCFEGERFVITWAIGHLVELDEPASYNPAWRAWRIENLPMLPDEFRLHAHHWLILHGRYVCKARRPECWRCPVADLCRYPDKTPDPAAGKTVGV